jgi:hypothetical protein
MFRCILRPVFEFSIKADVCVHFSVTSKKKVVNMKYDDGSDDEGVYNTPPVFVRDDDPGFYFYDGITPAEAFPLLPDINVDQDAAAITPQTVALQEVIAPMEDLQPIVPVQSVELQMEQIQSFCTRAELHALSRQDAQALCRQYPALREGIMRLRRMESTRVASIKTRLKKKEKYAAMEAQQLNMNR